MTVSFTLSAAAEALRCEVRTWAVQEGRPFAREADTLHDVPDRAKKVLATCPVDVSPLAGPFQPPGEVEREYVATDGGDGSNVLGVVVAEELAYGDPFLFFLLPGTGLGPRVIRLLGTPEQIERWADGVDRGDYNYNGFALTEPGCGSDPSSLATTAVRDGDSWVLNGTKIFCSNGAVADYTVVFATVDRSLGYRGIRGFVVEAGTPGFTVAKANESKLGLRYMMTSELALSDVVVPADHCLGAPGQEEGLRAALGTLSTSRPVVAAISVGLAQAALDTARQLLDTQQQCFSAKRWSRITDEFARFDMILDHQRFLFRRAAWRMDRGLPVSRESSVAKASAPPVAEHAIFRALALLGADGYSNEHLVEKWYRDVKIMDIFEGTGNIQRLVITRHLFGPRPAGGVRV